MNAGYRQNASQEQKQRQALSPAARQGLRLLEMDLADLRTELYRELAENPIVESIESPAEPLTTSDVERFSDERERAGENDWPDDADSSQNLFEADADALERRRRFFDSLTRPETLQAHLRAQLGSAGLDEGQRALASILVGYLDQDGRFTGSLPDLVMSTGATEEKIRGVLRAISTLDPPGCGTTSLQECLLAQLDRIEEPFREEMRELISSHLQDLAARDYDKIEAALGLSRERLEDDIARLKTLEPHPGRAFAQPSADEQYVRAEVHAVRDAATGRWMARVDERDMPEIHFSERYLKMLQDPDAPEEAKEYIRSKLSAVEQIREAIANRSETIRSIAQAIFDAQQGFFEAGPRALKPLTMNEIAERVGVHHSTVSRTVGGKYATTPFGTMELREFFVSGVTAADGEEVSRNVVDGRLAALVAAENPASPLSDERLATLLKAEGYSVARRTVAKYRARLGIPGAAERAAAAKSKGYSST